MYTEQVYPVLGVHDVRSTTVRKTRSADHNRIRHRTPPRRSGGETSEKILLSQVARGGILLTGAGGGERVVGGRR